MNTKFRQVWQRPEGQATFSVEKSEKDPIYRVRLEDHLYGTSSPDCVDHEQALGKTYEFVKRHSPEGVIWDLTGALSAEPQIRIDLTGYARVLQLDGCQTIMVLGENLNAETRAALQPKFRQAATIEEALQLLMKRDGADLQSPMVAAASVGGTAQSVTVKGVIYKDDKILIGASFGRTLIGLLAVIVAKGLWGLAGSFVAGAAAVILVQVFWHVLKK